MMQEEVWIAWGDEEVAAWVTTNPVVTSSMHAEQARREIALHDGLEIPNIGVLGNQVGGVGVGRGDAGSVYAQITAKTTWVIAEAVGLRVGWCVVENRDNWAQVHSKVLERPAVYTSTTSSRWEEDVGSGRAWNITSGVIVIFTVAAHTGVAAVKDRGVSKIKSILSPVEIGLVPVIAAFFSESLFVGVDVVSMPG